jgi:hypothetical protein
MCGSPEENTPGIILVLCAVPDFECSPAATQRIKH